MCYPNKGVAIYICPVTTKQYTCMHVCMKVVYFVLCSCSCRLWNFYNASNAGIKKDRIEGTFRTVYTPLRELAIVVHTVHVIASKPQIITFTQCHTIYIHVILQEAEIIVLNSNSYFCDACDVHVTVVNKILSAVASLISFTLVDFKAVTSVFQAYSEQDDRFQRSKTAMNRSKASSSSCRIVLISLMLSSN